MGRFIVIGILYIVQINTRIDDKSISSLKKLYSEELFDYKRFKEELKFYTSYPYLGPCVDFGLGSPCIEESNGTFKYYVIDRGTKFQFEEFTDVRDAIDHLVDSGYAKYELVNDPNKMKNIIYETLGLEKDRTIKK